LKVQKTNTDTLLQLVIIALPMQKKTFKVEVRKNCKICGSSLPLRYRTYCSKKCRDKATNFRYKEYQKGYAKKEQELKEQENEMVIKMYADEQEAEEIMSPKDEPSHYEE